MAVHFEQATHAHMTVAHDATLASTSWTYSIDVRTERDSDDHQAVLMKGRWGESNYELILKETAGDQMFTVLSGFWIAGPAQKYIEDDVQLLYGRWYRIYASYDVSTGDHLLYYAPREWHGGAAPTVYTLIASDTHAGPPSPVQSTNPLTVGANWNSGGTALDNGGDVSVEELCIYDAVIPKATMESRLSTRLVGNEANLAAYYRFDEGLGGKGGDTVYDRSGNGNTGTLRNGATWADGPMDLYYPHGIGSPALGLLGWHHLLQMPLATVVCSDEDSDYPATNLLDPRQARTSRTNDVTGNKTWTIDAGELPPGTWAYTIHNHNLTSAATIALYLHSSDAWGGPDVTIVPTYHPSILAGILDVPQQYRYAQLKVADAANGDGYLELGTLCLWHCMPLSRPLQLEGETWGAHDPSTAVETLHNHETYRERTVGRDLSVSWHRPRRAWAMHLRDILRRVGGGAPVWLCPDPARELYRGVYGIITQLPTEGPPDPAWTTQPVLGLGIEADRP